MKPFNRHVLIKLIEKKEEQKKSLVVLPTDYKKPESPHLIGEVLDFATDISLPIKRGDKIVFEKRTLQKIEIDGELHYLILENYVYGRI